MNPESRAPDPEPARLARGRDALSVSELNQAVARTLERSFPLVHVRGEISNLTRAASGHWYFSLKDDAAQVRCAMFRGRAQYADSGLREGDAVEVRAQVRLYEARGEYQLVVDSLRRAGLGSLLEAFNRLKERLAREGLFDAGRKRTLPAFVRAVGIVSSLEAAALRDVATTLQSRAPHVRIIVYPTPVQGEGAADRIAAAIAIANARRTIDAVDLLIVCRGGGSIEDLWPFNEEVVARAIAASELPVVSGVGHETDITIADFVVDVRAPTPTGAAHIAARARSEWLVDIDNLAQHMRRAMRRTMEQNTLRIDSASGRLVSPLQRLRTQGERIEQIARRLDTATRRRLESAVARLTLAQSRHARLRPSIDEARERVARLAARLRSALLFRLETHAARLAHCAGVLDAISPQATLRRGYAIVTRDDALLTSIADARTGDAIAVRLVDGTLGARIDEIRAQAADFGD